MPGVEPGGQFYDITGPSPDQFAQAFTSSQAGLAKSFHLIPISESAREA
jgi:hypothetical protein